MIDVANENGFALLKLIRSPPPTSLAIATEIPIKKTRPNTILLLMILTMNFSLH